MDTYSKKVICRFGWMLYWFLTALSFVVFTGSIFFLYKVQSNNIIEFSIVFSFLFISGSVYFFRLFARKLNEYYIDSIPNL